MTLGIGTGGLSPTQRAQQIQRSGSEHELDKIEPVTVPKQGSVSSQQHAAASQRSPSPTQNPKQFVMSEALKTDAAALVKALGKGKQQRMTGDQLLQRMKLEGRLIAEHQAYATKTDKTGGAALSYAELSRELGIEDPLPAKIDERNVELDKNLKALDAVKDPNASHREQLEQMTQLFKKELQTQTELFAHRSAQYEEMRNLPKDKLSEADKENVLLSEMSFSVFATHSACAIPGMITTVLTKAETTAKKLEEAKNETEAKEWNATAAQLKTVQKEVLPDFKNAIDQAKLSDLIDRYQKTSSNPKTQMLTFMLQFLRQLGLSGLALGAARTFTLAALSEYPAAQPIIAGVATAFAHELGTHLLAPAIVAVFGGETVPVDTSQVLPPVNKFKSTDGVVLPRNPGEIKAEEDKLAPYRQEHIAGKNANKVGTATGEVKAWSQFAAVQGAIAGVVTLAQLSNAQGAGGTTGGSMLAGGLMGGIHGADGLNAKSTDPYERKLPSNIPKPPTNDTFPQRMSKVREGAIKKLNPFDAENFSMLMNKSAGLIAGIALSDAAVTGMVSRVAESSPEVRAGVAFVAGGIGSVVMLTTAWSSFVLDAQVKADIAVRDAERDKNAPESAKKLPPSDPRAFDRARTAALNVFFPGRSQASHATPPGEGHSVPGLGRAAENVYLMTQGALTLPTAVLTDGVRAIGNGIGSGINRLRGSKDEESGETPDVKASTTAAGGVTEPAEPVVASSRADAGTRKSDGPSASGAASSSAGGGGGQDKK